MGRLRFLLIASLVLLDGAVALTFTLAAVRRVPLQAGPLLMTLLINAFGLYLVSALSERGE